MPTIFSMEYIRRRAISGMSIFFSVKTPKESLFPIKLNTRIPPIAGFIPRHTFKASRIVAPNAAITEILTLRNSAKITLSIIESLTVYVVSLYRSIDKSQYMPMHQDARLAGPIISRRIHSPSFLLRCPSVLDKFDKIFRVHKGIKPLCKLNIGYARAREPKQMLSTFAVLPAYRTLFIPGWHVLNIQVRF